MVHRNQKNYQIIKGRDWTVHVDNCDRDTVAIVNIQTIEHFNKVMELLDIQFKLTNPNYNTITHHNS